MGILTHTHTNPTHTAYKCYTCSAWHAVTPPVTIVLPLDAKLWDLAMHVTVVAAVEYLGSQLMSQNVESVHENVYFGISLAQKEHVNWYIHSPATNPVCVVRDVYDGDLTVGFNETAAITVDIRT